MNKTVKAFEHNPSITCPELASICCIEYAFLHQYHKLSSWLSGSKRYGLLFVWVMANTFVLAHWFLCWWMGLYTQLFSVGFLQIGLYVTCLLYISY
jgi:hypothetical protein